MDAVGIIWGIIIGGGLLTTAAYNFGYTKGRYDELKKHPQIK